MDTFVQDLRHSLRLLRNAPGFTFAAVTALALGIGANTAIFSVLNTVILKPLPYPDPERLVMFLNVSPQGSGGAASPTKFNVWRRQTGAFEDVSAYRFSVSSSLFSTWARRTLSFASAATRTNSLCGPPFPPTRASSIWTKGPSGSRSGRTIAARSLCSQLHAVL